MLTLDFINVGYGDALLIRDVDEGFSMLVDCGDIAVGDGGIDSGRISAAEFLRKENIHTINLLVLTHLHRDHSGGLTDLLKVVDVREFWCNYLPPHIYWGKQVCYTNPLSDGARCLVDSLNILLSALADMEKKNTVIRKMERSLSPIILTQSIHADIHLESKELFQQQNSIFQHVLDGRYNNAELQELDRFINNTSLRMRLACGNTFVELPGDVYAACWEKHELSPCTIMKLPHHGHKDSLTPKLLDMLSPKHVVISVSNNRSDDCPSSTVIKEILRRKCQLYITDAMKREDFCSVTQSSVRFELPS